MRLKRSDKILLGLLLLPLTVPPANCMQQTTQAGLHHRSDQDADSQDQPRQDSQPQQLNTLPADVSGSYDFDHRNESIEIDIGGNKLTGYISRLGDAETDNNTPLTFFFDRSSVVGNQIQFQTRVVHGVWYSFHGTILRGDGKTRDDEGYYVLHGSLQKHHPRGGEDKSADETIENRSVDFKSMRQ